MGLMAGAASSGGSCRSFNCDPRLIHLGCPKLKQSAPGDLDTLSHAPRASQIGTTRQYHLAHCDSCLIMGRAYEEAFRGTTQ